MNYERFEHGKKKVFLVDMKEDLKASLFSSLARKTLESYLPKGKKVLIIGGKKGLASGAMCQDCGYIPKCTHCDIPIAYHKDHAGHVFGICHICKTSYSALDMCPTCQGYAIDLFGIGLQKIQSAISTDYPSVHTLCLSAEEVHSLPKVQRVTQSLGHVQCLIATSLLQIPPRDWKPDVVIVLRADSSLRVPDWKVSEHCYRMLQHCIQNYTCPVIVQAYDVTHHAIRAACANNDEAFWEYENHYREQYKYPPYVEMALILYKHEIEETMFTRVNTLYQELLFLQKKEKREGEIFATPPLLYKAYDTYRYNIVVKGDTVRSFLEQAFVSLKVRERGFKIDRMPENII